MNVIFVNHKSDLTEQIGLYEGTNFKTFRTRTTCNCSHKNNNRNAVLVLSPTGYVNSCYIRCKQCKLTQTI